MVDAHGCLGRLECHEITDDHPEPLRLLLRDGKFTSLFAARATFDELMDALAEADAR